MKRFRTLITILCAITMALSVTAVSMKEMVVSAETTDVDIEGIVSQVTLDRGDMAAVIYEVNRSTGMDIDENIEEMEEVNKQEEAPTDIVARDWSSYSSSAPMNNLSESESTFYSRFVELAQYYMDNSTIDAYYVKNYDLYCINGVKFADLGLTSQEAFYVAQWFVYENPQYYFLKPTFLVTSSAVYVSCIDVAVDGDDRAAITNEMFAGIDDMAAYATSLYSTDYDIEKCIHDLVCGSLLYRRNDYDQSIYSAMYLGETVCAGYAGTMSVLLNKAGIDTVTGLSDCHAWNEVFVDGEWYGVDATWDDSLSSYTFFDVSDESLKAYDSSDLEHTIETSWVSWTPALADHDYGSDNHGTQELTLATPNVSIERIDDTAFRARWTVVPNATAYEFSLYVDGTEIKPIVVKTIVGYSIKIQSLTPGKTYYVGVRALNDSGSSVVYSESAWADYTCPLPDTNPEPEPEPAPEPEPTPQSVVAVPGNVHTETIDDTSFRLSWDAAEGAAKYEIGLYKDSEYTSVLATGATQKTAMKITGITPGQNIYIRIRSVAIDDTGSRYSDYVDCVYAAPSGNTSVAPSLDDNEDEPQNTTAIPVPANMHADNVTDASCKIIWDEVSYAKYEIEIANVADFSKILAKGTTSKVRMNISGLSDDTHYWVRVRAMINNEYSDWAVVDFVTDSSTPFSLSTPASVSVATDKTSASATWSDVVGADGYNIVVCNYAAGVTAPTSKPVFETTVTGTPTVNITGLTQNTAYNIFVQAYCNKDEMSYVSDWSKPVAFTTKKDIVVSTPTNVNAQSVTKTSAQIKWDAVECDGYEVICKHIINDSNRLGARETVVDTNVDTNEFVLDNLTSGQQYVVNIRAYVNAEDKIYYSGWSDMCDFDTASDVVLKLSAPTNVQVVEVTTSSVKISYNGDANASRHYIEIAKDAKFTQLSASGTLHNQIVNIKGFAENTVYYIRLKAIDNTGTYEESDWTVLSVQTKGTKVSVPTNIRSLNVSEDTSRLMWDMTGAAPKCEVLVYKDAEHTKVLGSIVTSCTSLKISGMKPGNSYYFALRVIDTINDKTYYSEWVNVHIVKN